MNDRAALFASVLDEPSDDSARLILADWLDDHDESPLGRLLRAGVIASRYCNDELIESPDYYRAVEQMAAVARSGEPVQWLAALGIGSNTFTGRNWSWESSGDRLTVRISNSAGVFARGLLAELELPLTEWYEVACKALTTWPLERVVISDVPGLTFTIDRVASDWRLTGQLRLPRRNVPLTGTIMPSAVSSGAILAESPANWTASQSYETRQALVAGIASESASIVADLKDAIGDRWPRPRRRT